MEKLKVYFNEYNVLMDNAVYLPLVSGLLQAYAQTKPLIQEKYQFMPFIFIRDQPEKILAQYQNPSVAVFSVSMWNLNLSLNVAEKIKRKFPKCLIVFGGPQVPFNASNFLKKYPFIDVTVRGEGEKSFANLLERFLDTKNFKDIPGISWRNKDGRCIRNNKEVELIENLDELPSPYLEGVFDYLMPSNIDFQAIVETNRGCPFLCSFCFWGKRGLNKRFRFFSPERIKKVAQWCGENKIKYVFCADSNFGMIKRDFEMAQFFVQSKVKYGFPEKFRVPYGKNAEDNIYEIGKLLHKHCMEKGITISRQSNSPKVLSNIGRKNIQMSVYNNLQRKYNKENIPVYTELILGLPGETYQSFVEGLEEILQSGIKNQLFVYHCQVYPNTELTDEKYQEKFGISTKSIPLSEVHGAVRPQGSITEYEDIIISTNDMSEEDWKKATVISWVMQLFHGLKLGYYILDYLVDRHNVKYTDFFEYIAQSKIKSDKIKILKNEVQSFYEKINSILQGNIYCRTMPDFGNIYWEPEEASFLSISNNKESFYEEMYELIKEFLGNRDFNEKELKEVIEYQKARIPDYKSLKKKKFHFEYNIPEYFDTSSLGNKCKLSHIPQTLVLDNVKDYDGDKKTFAKEIILWGRKSDKILYPVKWFNTR